MAEILKVSQSKVKVSRKCWYAYHLKYIEKLKRRAVTRPLDFGGLAHKMIETAAQGKNPNKVLDEAMKNLGKIFAGQRQEYAEILDDLDVIMSEYFEYWKDNEPKIEYVEIDGKVAEHRFETEIADNIVLTGVLDSIVTTKNGKRWLVDIKSHGKALPGFEDRWMNLQSTVYFKAMKIMGWEKVTGIMWDYIYSKAPTVPSILKNGTMSKKKIVTLPSVVEAFAAENDLEEEEYKATLDVAIESREDYFERIFTPMNQTVVDSIFDDFVESSKLIQELGGKCKAKTIDRHCSWCEFKSICQSEMSGGDTDQIKERMFTNASQREKNEEASKSKKTKVKKNVSRSKRTRRSSSKAG